MDQDKLIEVAPSKPAEPVGAAWYTDKALKRQHKAY